MIRAFVGIFSLFATFDSQSIRKFLSYKYFVLLGGIFPYYPLHGTFIRIPLQWCLIRLLRYADSQAVRLFWEEIHLNAYLICGTLSCRFAAAIIYVL